VSQSSAERWGWDPNLEREPMCATVSVVRIPNTACTHLLSGATYWFVGASGALSLSLPASRLPAA